MSAAAEPVPVNASRFRAAHAEGWARLETLVGRVERRSLGSLDDDDLLALPLLYRQALSSLSVARETSLDRALVAYLEQLCTRAYFLLYGVPTPARAQLARFLARGWPAAVRGLWRETLVAALITFGGALAAFLLVRADPSWFYLMLPDGIAQGRDPAASAASLRQTLHDTQGEAMLVTFAAYLFTHNAQIAIFAFALGFAFAVPSALLLAYNGVMLGAFAAVFAGKGVGPSFAAWIMIHGTTELFAGIIAGAAGLRIGSALAFPGRAARLDAMVAAGRPAAVAMAGAVVMLIVAGLLEGIGRQTVTSDAGRAAVGAMMLAGWLLYFYLPRRRDAAR